jgi:bacillithiol system protein YtxJ
MSVEFITVATLEQLDKLIESSFSAPIFIFKHSNSCGISHDVMEQIEALDHKVHVVIVQETRAISDAIADKLGIRHASPQAFVLKDGKAAYHATHYGIDVDAITNHLK